MAGRERDDPVELPVEERVARDNERAYVLGDDGRKCILEIAFAAGVEDMDRLANCTSCSLRIAQQQIGFRTVGVDEDADEGASGHQFARELELLCVQHGRELRHPGGVEMAIPILASTRTVCFSEIVCHPFFVFGQRAVTLFEPPKFAGFGRQSSRFQ